MVRSLKWKIFLLFGVLVLVGVSSLSYVIFQYAAGSFSKQVGTGLKATAECVAQLIDAERLETIQAQDDPYHQEVKHLLWLFSERFNLSWLGLYRYNGRFLVHVADGSDLGDGFCYGYPIMDVPEEIPRAWETGEPTSTDSYQDAFGNWAAAFHPIRNKAGKVVGILDVSRDMDEVGELRQGILVQTIRLTVLIGLVTLVTCFLVAGFTTRPLEQVSRAVQEISGGRLNTRIPRLTSSLEIETFVDSFNAMMVSLEKSQSDLHRRIGELKALNEISEKINFASSTLEILKVILEKSVQSLEATRGSIMLFDEEKQALVVQVVWAEGIEHATSRIEIRPGEGVAGKAFADMVPVVFNRIPDGTLKPYEEGISSSIQNILCVPLLMEKKPIGVVNIVNRRAGEFGEADIALASTMGAQVALTLEKARLYEMAITDGLTKLYVHRYFQLSLDNELRRSHRYGKAFALILFDIDHFKKFNDTWGHQTGDMVLSHVARVLKENLRAVDLAARYGGEEFAVILPESDLQSGFAVAERIRKAVEAFDFPGQSQVLKVTISLGISSFPLHGTEKLDLVRKADLALYKSKERGRNTATVFDESFGNAPPAKH